jgi:chromosome segregation ATPase
MEIDLHTSNNLSINDDGITHLVDALSTSLSILQGIRGKLIDHYTYQEKLAIAQQEVDQYSQQVRNLENQILQQQSTIDRQQQLLTDRSAEHAEILTKLQEIITSVRSDLEQLKSHIWSQKQTIKGYQQHLNNQWTSSNLAIATKNYQLELSQAEILAQRDLSNSLDIQLQSAESKFNALVNYLEHSPLHRQYRQYQSAQWQELQWEIANLQSRIDYQSHHIKVSREQIHTWQQSWKNPYDSNQNPIPNPNPIKRSPTYNLTIVQPPNDQPRKIDIPRFRR